MSVPLSICGPMRLCKATPKPRFISEKPTKTATERTEVASSRAASAHGDDVEVAILKDANDALSRLMALFPSEHFDAAQKLAGRYVQTYVAK